MVCQAHRRGAATRKPRKHSRAPRRDRALHRSEQRRPEALGMDEDRRRNSRVPCAVLCPNPRAGGFL